jgi:pimeloyl-ACP methyl ester carboxylesterase
MSSNSFYLMATELQKRMDCEVITFDCRGHGETMVENEADLSLSTLVEDFYQIYKDHCEGKQVILVGHSMGAAICIQLMAKYKLNVIGTVCMDVVEGTALESLLHMKTYLASRPKGFESLEKAVEWSIQSKLLKNKSSAEISIPSQLVYNGDCYVWRTDLESSSPYWQEWFTGMSTAFLTIRGARLLLLAGTDRLDKVLTIGQMQGKFQMEVLSESGHSIQEDVPDKVAEILVQFYKRNQPLDISKIKKVF